MRNIQNNALKRDKVSFRPRIQKSGALAIHSDSSKMTKVIKRPNHVCRMPYLSKFDSVSPELNSIFQSQPKTLARSSTMAKAIKGSSK